MKRFLIAPLYLALCLCLGACGTTQQAQSGAISAQGAQTNDAPTKEDVLDLLDSGYFTKAKKAVKKTDLNKSEQKQLLAYGSARYIAKKDSVPTSMYDALLEDLQAFAESDSKLIKEITDDFDMFIRAVKSAYLTNYEKASDLDRLCAILAEKVGESDYATIIGIAKQKASVNNLVATTDASNIEQRLQEQPAFIASATYAVQDDNWKSLYPDMLCFSIQNNSGKDIKDADVDLVAWDSNNAPVTIASTDTLGRGDYLVSVNCTGINIPNGQASSADGGLELQDPSVSGIQISTFKAIVKDVTYSDGSTWENPFYDVWVKIYKNQRLQ